MCIVFKVISKGQAATGHHRTDSLVSTGAVVYPALLSCQVFVRQARRKSLRKRTRCWWQTSGLMALRGVVCARGGWGPGREPVDAAGKRWHRTQASGGGRFPCGHPFPGQVHPRVHSMNLLWNPKTCGSLLAGWMRRLLVFPDFPARLDCGKTKLVLVFQTFSPISVSLSFCWGMAVVRECKLINYW